MATKKSKRTTSPEERRDPNAEQPLYSASYTLNERMITDASTLVAGSRVRDVMRGTSVVLLLIIVSRMIFPAFPTEGVVACAIAACVLMVIGDRWPQITRKRIRDHGYDLGLYTEDQRACTVDVFEDRVEVSGPGDRVSNHPLSSLTKVFGNDGLGVMEFGSNEFAIVPRSAMSLSRFNALLEFAKARIDDADGKDDQR